ncbi:MAG: ABC transporter permease [Gemmataceae bacterium]|nr:ABC transporter permease [Gemmataceae bacterium]
MIGHAAAVWRFRYFLLALVKLDVRRRYTRSVIGAGWSIVNPVVMALVFAVVFSNLLGNGTADYTAFLILGMTLWGFFKECAVGGSSAMTSHETYIRQSPLPYALYPLRLVLGTAVHSGIAFLAALAVVVAVKGSFPDPLVLLAVAPALALAVVFGWAVAAICSCAQVYFHDTSHLLEVVAQFGFFLTPIVYPPELLVNKGLRWLVVVNPVNLFLELVRTPLLHNDLPSAQAYGYAVAVTTVAVGLAAGVIAWAKSRLIFRL